MGELPIPTDATYTISTATSANAKASGNQRSNQSDKRRPVAASHEPASRCSSTFTDRIVSAQRNVSLKYMDSVKSRTIFTLRVFGDETVPLQLDRCSFSCRRGGSRSQVYTKPCDPHTALSQRERVINSGSTPPVLDSGLHVRRTTSNRAVPR